MNELDQSRSRQWRGAPAALAIAVLLSASALEAQRPQGRVFTNDDIETSPPAAASEATAEPRQPNPETGTQPSDQADQSPQGDEAKRLTALRNALGEASDELTARIQRETNQTLIDRWTAMNDCLANVLKEYQAFLDALQARQGQSSQ